MMIIGGCTADYAGDHPPYHVHIIHENGRPIGRFDLERQRPMDDFKISKRLETDSGTGRLIGQRIRALRRERHLTQAQLGRMAGLQRPNISRLEAGTHLPSLLSIQRVADALGVTVSDIVAMPTM